MIQLHLMHPNPSSFFHLVTTSREEGPDPGPLQQSPVGELTGGAALSTAGREGGKLSAATHN